MVGRGFSKSETIHRKNDLNTRLGKLPETPRSTAPNAARTVPRNNDTLSLRPLGSQPKENLDLKGNDPRRFNPSMRPENSAPFQPGRIAPEVSRRNESFPKNLEPKREGNREAKPGRPNDGTPQPGRILTPNQPRTLNSPPAKEQPRIQIPIPQPPNDNRQPLKELRNRKNAQKETRSTPLTTPGERLSDRLLNDREKPAKNDSGKKPKQ